MAVCGVPDPVADHADRAADFALALLRSMDRVAASTGVRLSIRVGLHSGPVTAGVLLGERRVFARRLCAVFALFFRIIFVRLSFLFASHTPLPPPAGRGFSCLVTR